jgi:hypothetical protein
MSSSAINVTKSPMSYWALMRLKTYSARIVGCVCGEYGRQHPHISRGMDGRARRSKTQNSFHSLYQANARMGIRQRVHRPRYGGGTQFIRNEIKTSQSKGAQ